MPTTQLRAGDAEEAGMSAERVRRIAGLGRRWVADEDTSALVLLVARRGVVVLHEAFGRFAPDTSDSPPPLDAVFPLASISKPVTATAVMCLVEDGVLGLNRPVQEYVPEFAGQGKEAVMVHHLLTHTAGLWEEDLAAHVETAGASTSVPACPPHQHPLIHEHLVRRYGAPLRKPPGQEMAYTSYGYELLGEIVGRLSGKPLAAVAAERVFAPLGMADTSYALPEARWGRLVGRPAGAPTLRLVTPERLSTPWAGGGVFSTARDMAAFGQMFLNRGAYGGARVLSPASVAAMTRNQIPGVSVRFGPEFFAEAGWGLGWDVQGDRPAWRGGSLRSAAAFGHNGAGGTYLWVDPVHDLVGVYFSVVRAGTPGLFARWSADLFVNAVMAAVVGA